MPSFISVQFHARSLLKRLCELQKGSSQFCLLEWLDHRDHIGTQDLYGLDEEEELDKKDDMEQKIDKFIQDQVLLQQRKTMSDVRRLRAFLRNKKEMRSIEKKKNPPQELNLILREFIMTSTRRMATCMKFRPTVACAIQ